MDVCLERVIRRGVWEHFKNKSRAELKQYLVNSEFVVNTAFGYLRKRQWDVIEVDNGCADYSKANAELRLSLDQVFPLVNQPHAEN